jgi:hypothetical protein
MELKLLMQKKFIVVSIEEFFTAKDDDAQWDRNS